MILLPIAALVALILGLIAFAVALYLAKRAYDRDLADEQQKTAATNYEWQKRYDVAVTATLTAVREKMREILPETDATKAVFEAVVAEQKGVQGMLQDFTTRVSLTNAALEDARRQTTNAASEVMTVRADNTLLRVLLERALTLPETTTDLEKARFLARARAALDGAGSTWNPQNTTNPNVSLKE